MKKSFSISILTLLNVGILLILSSKVLQNIDTGLLMEELRHTSLFLGLFVMGLTVLLIFFYGCRISNLIETSTGSGFSIASVGYGANHLFPFRLGEGYRIWFSKKRYDISPSRSLSAIFFERVSDLFCLACLSLFVLINQVEALPLNKYWIILILILSGLFFYTKGISKSLVIYSLLIWNFTVFTFFVFFKYYIIDFTLIDAISLTLCTSLSFALSTLPSGIGIFEASVAYYLNHFKQVTPTTALALAIVIHMLILTPQLVLMFYKVTIRSR